MIFTEITLFDLDTPRKGRETKKTGYRWTPTQAGKGRGFYMAMTGFRMDKRGSSINLRIELVTDAVDANSRLRDISGYYCDEHGDGDTLQPIIARLPSGRGFLAGWTMGPGMCGAVGPRVYSELDDAARAAHRMAESDAEQAIIDNQRESAEMRLEDIADEIKHAYAACRALCAEVRANCEKLDGLAVVRGLIRAEVRRVRREVRKLYKEREELRAELGVA